MQSTATPRPRRVAPVAMTVALAIALVGCGSGDSYKNQLRPPSPINVTAYISNKSVSVSPATFGAGPIVMIVTNQSDRSQDTTFETDTLGTGKPGTKQSVLINPGQTGQLKLDVGEGSYTLKVGDDQIHPASVVVGAKRPSAQNTLLQP